MAGAATWIKILRLMAKPSRRQCRDESVRHRALFDYTELPPGFGANQAQGLQPLALEPDPAVAAARSDLHGIPQVAIAFPFQITLNSRRGARNERQQPY
jgi:hypothetical protein